jgi:hypothetical protein
MRIINLLLAAFFPEWGTASRGRADRVGRPNEGDGNNRLV